MNDSHSRSSKIFDLENIRIGDGASKISSAIFFIVCFLPVFGTVLFGAVDNMTWVLISLLWAGMIILWSIEAWRAKGLVFSPSALQLPLIAIVLIGLVQLLPLGSQPDGLTVEASRAISMDPYATRFFLSHLVVLIVYFAACLSFINTERRLSKTVYLVVIFGAVIAFFGILQHLANPDGIYGLRVPFQANPFGPFVNQHHFAALMEMTGGMTLGLILGSATRERKILFVIAFVIMVAAIILTSSRGGMLSLLSTTAFVCAVTIINKRRTNTDGEASGFRQKVALAGGAFALVLVVLVLVLFLGGDQSLVRGVGLSEQQDFSSGRLHFWSIALRIFADHPILGAGLDAFGVAFTKYDTWNGIFRVEQAHNDYLQMLSDAGGLGLACVLAFLFLLFKKSLSLIASLQEGFRRDVAIGALAGCLGIAIHSFFDFPLRTYSNSFFFLLLAALATVSVRTKSKEVSTKHRKRRSTSRSH